MFWMTWVSKYLGPWSRRLAIAGIVGFVAAGLAPRVAQAQTLGVIRSAVLLPQAAPSLQAELLRPNQVDVGQSDYRWEGLTIGAIGVGVLGALLANGLCDEDSGSDSCTGTIIGGAAVGALIGGVVGVFIGSGIQKGG